MSVRRGISPTLAPGKHHWTKVSERSKLGENCVHPGQRLSDVEASQDRVVENCSDDGRPEYSQGPIGGILELSGIAKTS